LAAIPPYITRGGGGGEKIHLLGRGCKKGDTIKNYIRNWRLGGRKRGQGERRRCTGRLREVSRGRENAPQGTTLLDPNLKKKQDKGGGRKQALLGGGWFREWKNTTRLGGGKRGGGGGRGGARTGRRGYFPQADNDKKNRGEENETRGRTGRGAELRAKRPEGFSAG